MVSWNVRGLNEKEKILRIRSLLRDWKAYVVCLQETKLEFISREVIHNLWGCHHADWTYLGREGHQVGYC
jgi:exonuclease III